MTKTSEFRLKVQWNSFLESNRQWAGDHGLPPNRRQAIIRTYDGLVYWRIYMSFCFNNSSILRFTYTSNTPQVYLHIEHTPGLLTHRTHPSNDAHIRALLCFVVERYRSTIRLKLFQRIWHYRRIGIDKPCQLIKDSCILHIQYSSVDGWGLGWDFHFHLIDIDSCKCLPPNRLLWPLLLTWFNFNPSMDK